jgi:uncharacterized protein (DUF58 family)
VTEKLRDIVEPELLARLAHLSFRAQRLAEGVLTGMHKSPHHGASVEFAQHREYVPGDELKHIDWKAYAKSDRYQIKQYEDETNLRAFLLVDTSHSMQYGARRDKIGQAALLAAALGYLLLRQGDAVGLLTFGDKLGTYVPPRARPDHFWNLVQTLERAPVGGPTDISRALSHIAEVGGRRAVVFLFSDCLEFDLKFVSLCRQLRRRRHHVQVFQVLHPDEVDFPFEELTLFEELESRQTELADPRGMREQYLEEMQAFCDDIRKRLLEGDVGYRRVLTSDDPEPLLRQVIGGAGGAAGRG